MLGEQGLVVPRENEAHCYISTFLTPTSFYTPYTAYVFGRLDSNFLGLMTTRCGSGRVWKSRKKSPLIEFRALLAESLKS